MTGLRPERFEAPVVEDEQLDGAEALEAARDGAVAVGERQLVEELGDPDIEDGAVVAAGLSLWLWSNNATFNPAAGLD